MENRALIAFILSLAVFVLWGYFLTWFQGPVPPEGKGPQSTVGKTDPSVASKPPAVQTPASTPSGEAGKSVSGSPAVAQPTEAGPEELVTVSTGLVEYVFSTRGAALRELRIPKYHNPKGETINLVHQDKPVLPLTLVSSDPEISQLLQNSVYKASKTGLELTESSRQGDLTFEWTHSSGLSVTKKLSFTHDSYVVGLETKITGGGYAQKNLDYSVLWGPGLGGEVDSNIQMFTHTGPTTFVNDKRVENSAEDFTGEMRHQGDLKWTAFQNKYFAAALLPKKGIKSAVIQYRDQALYVGLDLEAVQSSASAEYLLYAGTKELKVLEAQGHKLVRLMDYGWIGNKFAFLVKPLLKVLQYFYSVTSNYGWSIIFLTFIIKVLFFPLTHKSFKSMKGMMKIQPYVKVIQERNKDDRQKMNEEMMDLYRKHRVNPLGGCLPMLLQIPVFIALYHVLFFSIELRGAPWLLWIHDLSVQDPFYVLPILMGASMFLQQKMTPTTAVDPIQQKIMMFLPIIFTFLFLSFPAGLVLYWTINNLLTIAQQFYIYRIAKD